jgi:hypothetical protein
MNRRATKSLPDCMRTFSRQGNACFLKLKPARSPHQTLARGVTGGGFGGIGHSKGEGCDHRELFDGMHVANWPTNRCEQKQ